MTKWAFDKIAAGLRESIEAALRQAYDDTVKEPVPDWAKDLLNKLK